MTKTTTWTQPSMPLTTSDDIDDTDHHLDSCVCETCIDNLILAMQEDRAA